MKSVAVVFVIAWFYLTRKLIYTRFWKHSKWDLRFSLPCTILCVVKSFQIGLSVKSKVTYLHLTEKRLYLHFCVYIKRYQIFAKGIVRQKKRHEGNKSKAGKFAVHRAICQWSHWPDFGWGHKGNLCLISIYILHSIVRLSKLRHFDFCTLLENTMRKIQRTASVFILGQLRACLLYMVEVYIHDKMTKLKFIYSEKATKFCEIFP